MKNSCHERLVITNTSFTITCIPDGILKVENPIHFSCLQFQYSVPSVYLKFTKYPLIQTGCSPSLSITR